MEDDYYLTRSEAAKYLRGTTSWLANLAWQGTGPKFYKHGSKVLYRRSDLDAWIQEGVKEPARVA